MSSMSGIAAVSRTAPAPKRLILLFRNDLRVHDQVLLSRALEHVQASSSGGAEILPLYCFDPRHYAMTRYGHPKTGLYRSQFILESVRDLKHRLRALGSDLLIKIGKPEDIIPPLTQGGQARVLASTETCSEEHRVDAAIRKRLHHPEAYELHWNATLYHVDDLPFARDTLHDLPDVFTQFRERIEKKCTIRPLLPTPARGALPLPKEAIPDMDFVPTFNDLPFSPEVISYLGGPTKMQPPEPDSRAVLAFHGGETEALKRLKYYLWDSNHVAKYFDTRNGMIGGDYSTKFAPWLSLGCLSPRMVHHELKKFEAQRVANKSTYWVVFELIWRDFFKFYALKHGNRIFFEGGPIGATNRSWSRDAALFGKWRDGMTGVPLVDANMRELAATGFMSNRGRQNVASYLALELGIDWRLAADYFESILLDHDVASNYGNWVSAAGLTGGRLNRFNMLKQSNDYDPEGRYVKLWCPELSHVPTRHVFEPSRMPLDVAQTINFKPGVDYPNPIPRSAMKGYGVEGDEGGGRGRGRGDGGGGGGGGRGGRGRGPR